MKPIKLLLIILLIAFLYDCSPVKKVISDKTYSFSLTFGKTGGFTNINPAYTINNTGEVFKKENKASAPVKIKAVGKQKTDSICLLIMECNFGSLKISNVSNITNYIDVKSDTINNKVTWFDDSQVPPGLLKLQQFLITIIKK